ncbi:MAG TPA: tetratricopeptide repeat protein [Proteobacteria bacterium]|nr:tetratricopeptide repeat protein [Pseudomonadota bacterium]
MMRSTLRTFIFLLLIICIGIVVYLPAFQASFHLDDGPSIRDNTVIRHLNPEAIFNFWPTRFFTYLSLAVTFRYAGLDPFLYHLGNFAIHLFNALVVFFLLRRIVGKYGMLPPLIGALIFLVHPLQTQAATYIIQRATSLAAGFYLLSILFYLKCFQVKKNSFESESTSTGRFGYLSVAYYILSLLSALCAMLTKEFTITLPGALILVEVLVLRDRRVKSSKKFFRLLPFIILLLIIPALTMIYSENPHYNDSGQVEWLKEAGVIDEAAPGHGESPRVYLLTQPRVFITYLRLLVLPIKQQVDYDYPKLFSLFNPAVIFPLLVIFSFVILACFYRENNLSIIAFGIFWFILTLLPESSIIPIIDVIVEHRLYLPLFGAVVVFTYFYGSLARFRRTRFILGVAVVFLLGWLTYQRNLVWRDPVSLWEDNVAKAPGRARIHGNLGKAYLDQGRYERAADEFKRLIEIDPTFAGAYNNLAVIYIDHIKDYRLARKYIEASLALFPDYPAGYLNLGVIDLNNRKLRSAIKNFEKALELDPKSLLAYYNLGACYINLGDLYGREAASLGSVKKQEKAEEKEALARDEYRRAEEFLRRGQSIWPEDPRFNVLLARLYKGMGKAEEAEEHFDKVRKLR